MSDSSEKKEMRRVRRAMSGGRDSRTNPRTSCRNASNEASNSIFMNADSVKAKIELVAFTITAKNQLADTLYVTLGGPVDDAIDSSHAVHVFERRAFGDAERAMDLKRA